jgi:lysophospholipase L1-like esterase
VAADVISLTPAVILLIYGLHAAQGQRASWEYAYRYAELLRAIRTALPGVPLFCSGFPPCNENLSAAFVQEWNAAVRSAANTVDNCPFIEAAGWWGTTNFYGGSGPVYVDSDRIHPNDAGHRFLADKYAAVIKQYMG